MAVTMKHRIVGPLLLLFVGAAGAIGYAATSHDPAPKKAAPAGQNDSSGTGTVGTQPTSGPSAQPTGSAGGTDGTGGTGGTGGTAQPTSGPAAQPTDTGGGASGSGKGGGPGGSFTIAGQVNGLVPGAAKPLSLTITNPNPWPIQVLTLDTQVGSADRSPCSGLTVGRYEYADGGTVVRVSARGTTTVTVPALLEDSLTVDQSACPAATFPLTFSGTAQMVAGR